jgi:ABC-type hemin transport system ATPase subunit
MSTSVDEQEPSSGCVLPGEKHRIYEAVREIAEKRAAIDQAKGMLMFVYGVDADAAFGLLRWQSQHHNVKLRLVAEQMLKDFSQASQQSPPVDRRTYDELLVTLHTRTEPTVLRDVVGDMAVWIDD